MEQGEGNRLAICKNVDEFLTNVIKSVKPDFFHSVRCYRNSNDFLAKPIY